MGISQFFAGVRFGLQFDNMCVIQCETVWLLLPFTQCYLKHCQPDPLQRFIRIHLDLSRVGEHLQLRHPGTGFEGALVEREEGNNDGSFHSDATYFQSEKARLLLRSVWVDFDCLAAPELLQVCQPVACLSCTLVIKHRVNEATDAQGEIIRIPQSQYCSRNRHITFSNHSTVIVIQ